MAGTALDLGAAYTLSCVPSREVTDELVERVVRGLTAAMPELRMPAYFDGRGRAELRTYDHVVVAEDRETGDLAGALASSWRTTAGGQRFLHLPLHMISGGWRGTGLFLAMWAHHWSVVTPTPESFPDVVALRTYNPLVLAFARSVGSIPGVTVYPRVDGGAQEPGMAALAADVAATISSRHPFEPDLGVVRGCGVPPDLYPALPDGVTGEVHDYFARHLAPADRVLCVARIEGLAAKRAVLERFGVKGANL